MADTHPYVVLDVFTDVPLQGNPVAVFPEAERIDPAALPALARELNLSETVFVFAPDDPARADARVRIFTPAVELPFAGHPVLGTAYVVARRTGGDTVRLLTGAGLVPVALTRRDGAIVSGEMEQPLPTWEPFAQPDELLHALGASASELPIEIYDNGPRHAYVVLPDVPTVSALQPDLGALRRLGAFGVSCVAVDRSAARSRMFGPGLGVAEDPATGSAAGPLAVHLARHGRIGFGATLTITQGVEIGRPSSLRATAHGSQDSLERVTVAGSAVAVAEGAFTLP